MFDSIIDYIDSKTNLIVYTVIVTVIILQSLYNQIEKGLITW